MHPRRIEVGGPCGKDDAALLMRQQPLRRAQLPLEVSAGVCWQRESEREIGGRSVGDRREISGRSAGDQRVEGVPQ